MRTTIWAVLTLATVAMFAPMSPAWAQGTGESASERALRERAELRDRIVAEAMEIVASADALEAYLAIDDALLYSGPDNALRAARRDLFPGAVEGALRRSETRLPEGRAERALDLLLRMRSGGASDDLTRAIDRARVARALERAALLEARGEIEEARRVCMIALNIAPDDAETLAALRRLDGAPPDAVPPGAAPPDAARENPPPSRDDADDARERPASLAPPADIASEAIARRALERRVDRIDQTIARMLTQMERADADSTLRPGAPQPATIELDRRLREVERDSQRLMNDLRRDIDRLSREVQSLRQEMNRLR